MGPLCPFLTLQGNFLGWSQVQKLFSNILIETINFGFGSTALSFVFNMSLFGASFGLFLALGGYFFNLLGLRSGSKTFLEPTNHFLFWNYSPIFLFLIRPNLGPFWPFRGYFWGWGQVQKLFCDLLT